MLQSAIKMKTPFVALYLCIVKPRMRAHTYIYYCMETKNKGNNIGVVHENSFVLFRAPRITGITGILQIQKIRVRTRQSKDSERYTRYAGNKTTNEHEPKVAQVNLH